MPTLSQSWWGWGFEILLVSLWKFNLRNRKSIPCKGTKLSKRGEYLLSARPYIGGMKVWLPHKYQFAELLHLLPFIRKVDSTHSYYIARNLNKKFVKLHRIFCDMCLCGLLLQSALSLHHWHGLTSKFTHLRFCRYSRTLKPSFTLCMATYLQQPEHAHLVHLRLQFPLHPPHPYFLRQM